MVRECARMTKPTFGNSARTPDRAISSKMAPKDLRTGNSASSEKKARVATAINTSRKGIANAARPNRFKNSSPMLAPTTPIKLRGGCGEATELKLASVGLNVMRLRNKSTAAATSRTASTSLT